MTVDFSQEITDTRRQRHDSFQMREENSRILYSTKLSFGSKGEITASSDEGKIRRFAISSPTLKKKKKKMAEGSHPTRKERVEGTRRAKIRGKGNPLSFSRVF